MNNDFNKNSLTETLHILELGRKNILHDFINKKNEIFLPMFKYENDNDLMQLSIDSYFTSWINLHFYLWRKNNCEESEKLFFEAIKKLLLSFSNHECEIVATNESFISRLISHKIDLINILITTGEMDSERYSTLLLEYEKDKVLFNREINKLARGNNGDSI